MKLDITDWKAYKIGDYFDVFTGGDLILRDIDDGTIPVCSHSAENNGVGAYVCNIPGRELFNCQRSICLADRGTFHATVQTKDYYIGTRVKALVLKEFVDIGVMHLLFIATVINNEAYRYSYGRNCTSRTEDIIIKLPSSSEGEPDWDFMQDYIKSLHHKELSTVNCRESKSDMLDMESWEEYRLGELFSEIYKAEAHVKSDMSIIDHFDTGCVMFISRTEENNGCDGYIENDQISGIEDGNAIIIGDTTATCFYQSDRFVAGDHIIVCRANWMNKYTALFVRTLLQKERYRYSYGRAYKMDLVKKTTIRLPTKDGVPDWKFIEKYMKTLPYGDKI